MLLLVLFVLWWIVLVGFVLFCLFDVWKLWLIGWFDCCFKSGMGVMVDDVVVGVFVVLVLVVLMYVCGVVFVIL